MYWWSRLMRKHWITLNCVRRYRRQFSLSLQGKKTPWRIFWLLKRLLTMMLQWNLERLLIGESMEKPLFTLWK
jgi:hypothetical protein